MASRKEDDGEWEDVVMMMELPNGASLDTTKKDLYLQAAGLWSDQPVVKLDNMLYVGKVSQTLGSHLFIECKEGDAKKQTKRRKDDGRVKFVSDSCVKLEAIYLERKTDASQPSTSGDGVMDTDKK